MKECRYEYIYTESTIDAPKLSPSLRARSTHMALSTSWGVLFVGVLITAVLLLKVYIRAPCFWKFPNAEYLWPLYQESELCLGCVLGHVGYDLHGHCRLPAPSSDSTVALLGLGVFLR